MKAFILSTFALASLVFVSCKANNSEGANDDADTTLQAAQQAAPSGAQGYSDRDFYNLRGPVRLYVAEFTEDTILFDRNGMIESIAGRNPFTENPTREFVEDNGYFIDIVCLHRDAEGRIAERLYVESYDNFHWKDGRILSSDGGGEGMEWQQTYTYNEKGDLVNTVTKMRSLVAEGEADNEWEVEETPVTGFQYDDHGNWVKANYSGTEAVRVIEYYK